MSDKQFKLSSETVLQYQIMNNDTDLNENEVVDLLNEQQSIIQSMKEEIKRLKCMNNQLERRLDYSIAYDINENERLNQVINDLHDDIRKYNRKVKMQDHIIDTQQDIINAFCELVGMINDRE